MSRRATLLIHYPSGASYYEIDGIFYRTTTLERTPITRQSRDPYLNSELIQLATIATITPETQITDPLILVSARLPDFTRPDNPLTAAASVLLQVDGTELTVSRLTPRQANAYAFTGPIQRYSQLAIPDLTAPAGATVYPRLPSRPVPEELLAIFDRLRSIYEPLPPWEGLVPLPLINFNPVAREMLRYNMIGRLYRLVLLPPLIRGYATMNLHQEAPVHQRDLPYKEAVRMLMNDRVSSFMVDPQNQMGVRPGNTRVTLIGFDGKEYDVVAQYNPEVAEIYPPL